MLITKQILFAVIMILAVLIAVYAFQYLSFKQRGFLNNKDAALIASNLWLAAFYLHVSFGGLALLVGGFQFIEPLRNKYACVHRNIGTAYVVSIFIGSGAGLALSFFANGGIICNTGFGFLAGLSIYSNYKGYATIKKGKITEHRIWMTRNYALTFAAVTLRLWLPILTMVIKMDFINAYRIVAWVSWIPNLIIAELLLQKLRNFKSPLEIMPNNAASQNYL